MRLQPIVARTVGEEDPADREASETEDVVGRTPGGVNVHRFERAASAILGGKLLLSGLRRRSLGGIAMAIAGLALIYRGVTGRSRLYRAAGVNTAASAERPAPTGDAGGVEFERSVMVDRPAEELSEMLLDPGTLASVLSDVAEVSEVGEDSHRISVTGPFDREFAWEARVAEERPGELLRWEATDDASTFEEAEVRFQPAPDEQGTRLHLLVRLDPPGGSLGAAMAERLDAVPESALGRELQRFKSLAETGEIPTLERNPSGRGSGDMV